MQIIKIIILCYNEYMIQYLVKNNNVFTYISKKIMNWSGVFITIKIKLPI
jgi:hypothetical protein